MSELYRRISLADRRERAKRERENDRKAREAAGADKADLLARFHEHPAVHPVCTHGVHLRSRCEDCEGWTDMTAPDLRESKG